MDREYRRSSMGSSGEDPPLSRLFIIGPKSLTEETYRKHFDQYGTIEELWMVKDKNTGEYKGITYIKYAKTSEAAHALEAMNGASLDMGTRRIRVMIAASRDQGSKRDSNEEEKTQRLFIVCPKSMTEDELYNYFKQFGDLEYVNIVKDRNTRDSKGIAYVKYYKFSHAAKAFEECEKKYKPVFAEPKKSDAMAKRGGDPRDFFGTASNNLFSNSGGSKSLLSAALPLTASASGVNEGYTKLTVIAHPDLNQDQLWKLFDIVPGMDYCQIRYEGGNIRPARALGQIVYSSSQWAAHAREKLHGFEYPPGFRLIVKPVFDGKHDGAHGDSQKPKEFMNIAETLAQASNLIQAAGLNPATLLNIDALSNRIPPLNCNIDLPDPRPLASIDAECKARCFIVCSQALPNETIRDLFCRFGSLIEAYMLSNRNCGYARYAVPQAAEDAIKTLHGAEVNGIRLKVMKAEEQRKRPRTDED